MHRGVAVGGGTTSYLREVLAVDAERRRKVAVRVGLLEAAAAVPVIVQIQFILDDTLLGPITGLVLASGLLGLAVAWVAHRGHGVVAGVILSAVPICGSLAAVLYSRHVGPAPLFCAVGMVVGLATLEGWPLRGVLISGVAAVVGMGMLALRGPLIFTPPAQLVVSGLVGVLLIGLIIAAQARALRSTLEAVAALQASAAEHEARFRLIAEHSTELVALVDAADQVVYASPSFVKVLGVDPTGTPAATALADDVDQSALETLLVLARSEQAARSELRRRRADGVVGRFACVISPVGETGLVLCVARDVTAERTMAADLEHGKKMEALGRFAGSIAHDFNNLLSVMGTCTSLATQSISTDSPARAELNDVQEAISRASGLTRQLLAFSRRDVVLPRRVEVEPLLRGAGELAQRLVGKHITVKVEVSPGVWPLWSGPSQIDQIVMNLAANARDAMPEGGVFQIEGSNATASVLGDAVLLVFSDTGTGMSAETRGHLFEPFFTTKAPGIGTGLGLATVFGVVKGLGGSIEVTSEPGQGTQFRVLLPRAIEGGELPAPLAPPLRQKKGHEATVLVVDDDPDVRALMVRLVSKEGFQVISAASAEQALALSLGMSELPVLVTDVLLPGHDGLWLAQRMFDRFPSMRVVLVSGFAPDPLAVARLVAQGARFVQKPLRPGALVHAVRDCLGMTPQPQLGAAVRPERSS